MERTAVPLSLVLFESNTYIVPLEEPKCMLRPSLDPPSCAHVIASSFHLILAAVSPPHEVALEEITASKPRVSEMFPESLSKVWSAHAPCPTWESSGEYWTSATLRKSACCGKPEPLFVGK